MSSQSDNRQSHQSSDNFHHTKAHAKVNNICYTRQQTAWTTRLVYELDEENFIASSIVRQSSIDDGWESHRKRQIKKPVWGAQRTIDSLQHVVSRRQTENLTDLKTWRRWKKNIFLFILMNELWISIESTREKLNGNFN